MLIHLVSWHVVSLQSIALWESETVSFICAGNALDMFVYVVLFIDEAKANHGLYPKCLNVK
jgi:hypothetical protein